MNILKNSLTQNKHQICMNTKKQPQFANLQIEADKLITNGKTNYQIILADNLYCQHKSY